MDKKLKNQVLVSGVRAVHEILHSRLSDSMQSTVFLNGQSNDGMPPRAFLQNTLADTMTQLNYLMRLSLGDEPMPEKLETINFPARTDDFPKLTARDESQKPTVEPKQAMDLGSLLAKGAANPEAILVPDEESSRDREFRRELFRVYDTAHHILCRTPFQMRGEREQTPSRLTSEALSLIDVPLQKMAEEGEEWHGKIPMLLAWSPQLQEQTASENFLKEVPEWIGMVQREWMIRLQGLHLEVKPATTFHYGSDNKTPVEQMTPEQYFTASRKDVAENGRQFLNFVGLEFGLGSNDCGVLMRVPEHGDVETVKAHERILGQLKEQPARQQLIKDLMGVISDATHCSYRGEADMAVIKPEDNMVTVALERAHRSAQMSLNPGEVTVEAILHERPGVFVPGVAGELAGNEGTGYPNQR